MKTPTTTPTTMDLIDDIAIHHETAIALCALIGLIGSGIGYEKHRDVAISVIEREILGAAASMTALTAKLRACLDEGE